MVKNGYPGLGEFSFECLNSRGFEREMVDGLRKNKIIAKRGLEREHMSHVYEYFSERERECIRETEREGCMVHLCQT